MSRRAVLFLTVAALVAAAAPAQAQVKTVYIVPGAHFDVGFDAPPPIVREHRIKAVEDALAAAEVDPDFHWMEDGGWGFGGWLERYRGDAARMQRARRALRSGQLIISAAWISPHGSIFHESLDLLTVHLDEMKRLFGVRPEVAILNDAPSQPEALVDALAARGVRYALVGANMWLTPPLPAKLVRSPFWWESAKGARLLVYIDPNSYGQALDWPWVTDTSRFSDAALSADEKVLLASTDQGFRKLLGETTSRYDAIVFENAFDDWPVSAVKDVAPLARLWTAQRLEPAILIASPLDYFRHIESRYGAELPVYRGEWGGRWDTIRAMCPAWTWRLRRAVRGIRPDAPAEVREAAATAMDHGLTLGPGWSRKFTEQETLEHAREQARIFARAVDLAGGPAVDALPVFKPLPGRAAADPRWKDVLSNTAQIRVRAGPLQIAPFIADDAPSWGGPPDVACSARHLVARARIDRNKIPGTDRGNVRVTLELPIRADKAALRIAPLDSPSALAGKWLCGAPPDLMVAPEGIAVTGAAHPFSVTSPLAFSYTLAADQATPGLTWLQVLLVWQNNLCELKDGTKKVLSFADLYPGEPAVLDTWVQVDLY